MKYFMIDNLVYGGAERQASYLINNDTGFDKVILLEDKIKYDLDTNIPIETIYPEILKIHQRFLGDLKSIKKLKNLFTSKDTVVSFLERSNIINIKSSLYTKHKSIISVRNYLSKRYNDPKYAYRMSQIKKYYPKADMIITNSKESKKDLIENFNVPENKVQVIYNIIDIENISVLKKEDLPAEHEEIFNKPVIINVGSLTPQKSQKQLIEAFADVKRVYPNYRLVIIGKGKLKEELLNTIKTLGLNNEVFLLGDIKNPFKYVYRADMFVLNSNFEGFPNVLLESLAVETPVISKNCLSGPKELLEVEYYQNRDIELTDYGFITPKFYNDFDYLKEKKYLIQAINDLIKLKRNDENLYEKLQNNCKLRSKAFLKGLKLNKWNNILN